MFFSGILARHVSSRRMVRLCKRDVARCVKMNALLGTFEVKQCEFDEFDTSMARRRKLIRALELIASGRVPPGL
jgi:hypothetical protein